MPTEEMTLSWESPTFQVDLTPVDVTLQFNAAGAGPIGPPGQKGDQGNQGIPGQSITGPQGLPGAAATVTVGATTTLAPGSNAQVTNSGSASAAILNFGVPAGTTGPSGTAATITAGTTTTGTPGTSAQVTNTGTSQAAVFNFTIPAGVAGATGPQGPPGGASANTTLAATFTMPASGSTAVASVANAAPFAVGAVIYIQGLGYLSATAVNTGTNQLTLQNLGYSTNAAQGSTAASGTTLTGSGPQGPSGATGAPGTAATITVGTTTTGAPGTNANVVQSGTPQASTLSFTIPQGNVGPTGSTGSPGTAATVAVGTTTTGAAGTNASVTNTGTANAAVFNFTIPQGVQGAPGVGDMTKAVYDTNNDGIVDTAAAVAWTGVTGKPATFPGDWSTTANKPATFPPSTHATTHNLGGSDAIAPDWTQVQNKPTAFAPSTHAASHVTGGSDIIALASTSSVGHLNQVSGNAADFVNGQNACSPLAPQIWSVRLRTFSALGNASFEVDQRQAGNLVAIANNGNAMIDRWLVASGTTTTMRVSMQRTAPTWPGVLVPGTPNFPISQCFLRITLTATQATLAAGDLLQIYQLVEGPNIREFGSDVTSAQVLVRSSVAGLNFGLAIQDPTAANSYCHLCNIPSANTWTLVTKPNIAAFPGTSTISTSPGAAGAYFEITLAAGSNFTASANDAWITGNKVGAIGQSSFASSPVNSTFDVAFSQWEPNSVCSQLIDKPFSVSLDECQRYFFKTYDLATAVGAATYNGDICFLQQSTNLFGGTFRFPKRMAKVPTCTSYSGSSVGAINKIRLASTDYAVTSFSDVGESGFDGINTATLPAPGQGTVGYAQIVADTGW